eukprot:TRINITY_DN67447_c0_g1_i1.p1 TRINITY_DN67447_c0_g1~~TRINITY_DN67447_c0_g1_i1.p1  ORF type:complete len:289 (-),score=34.61 TRINITY_DN67447_c0_g1_i1:18-884(-)
MGARAAKSVSDGSAPGSANAVPVQVDPTTAPVGGTPITLRVYSVSTSVSLQRLNKIFRVLGTGAYHAAVEVYGIEWSYGATATRESGVFWCPPGECDAHIYKERIEMGTCGLSQDDVDNLIDALAVEWMGPDYDLLRHNCCHFSDTLCRRLGVGGIPDWVLNLAHTGVKVDEAVAAVIHTGEEVLQRGKEVRGVDASASYHFGDLTRGLVGEAVDKGKEVRHAAPTGSYHVGDFSRGLAALAREHVHLKDIERVFNNPSSPTYLVPCVSGCLTCTARALRNLFTRRQK